MQVLQLCVCRKSCNFFLAVNASTKTSHCPVLQKRVLVFPAEKHFTTYDFLVLEFTATIIRNFTTLPYMTLPQENHTRRRFFFFLCTSHIFHLLPYPMYLSAPHLLPFYTPLAGEKF